MDSETKPAPITSNINYYVLAAIFILILPYEIINSIEPEVENELDFFEATRMLGFMSVSIFAFIVAKRYWISKQVFRSAYLALGIGYALYFMGDLLWYVYEIGYQVANPYPYYPDIGYFGFYPFAIWHLRTNVSYFKRKLDNRQKLLLVAIPVGISMIYAIFSLVPMEIQEGILSTKILPMPEYDLDFWKEFFTGLAYVTATTLTFSYAIIGAQVFRGGILGSAWGLILLGIALNTFADIHYYYFEIFGDYERQSPVHGIWLASTMIISYALYKHRKI